MNTKNCILFSLLLIGCAPDNGKNGDSGATGAKGQSIVGPIGPAGPQGLVGPVGSQGIQGLPGTNGLQGPPGLNGAPGKDGAPGLSGSVGPVGPVGLVGPTGSLGPSGLQGIPGLNGKDGIPVAHSVRGATLAECSTGGSVVEIWKDVNDNGIYDNGVDTDLHEALVCNGKNGKDALDPTYLCHIPNGKVAKRYNLYVPSNAVQAHLNQGDYLGDCL